MWRNDEELFAQMRARLSDGYVQDGVVECPLHFGKFDIRSGRALSPPCKLPLTVYAVRVDDGSVLVGVPATPASPGPCC